jgi:hypothetical protein
MDRDGAHFLGLAGLLLAGAPVPELGLLPVDAGGSLLRREEPFAPPLTLPLLLRDAIRLSNFLKFGFSPKPLAWLSDPKCSKICDRGVSLRAAEEARE